MNFVGRFSKHTLILTVIKIRPVGAKNFNADGQTDMADITVVFRNFANAPKKGAYIQTHTHRQTVT